MALTASCVERRFQAKTGLYQVTRYGPKHAAEHMASHFLLCKMSTTGFHWKRPITRSGFVDEMRRLFSKGVQRMDMGRNGS